MCSNNRFIVLNYCPNNLISTDINSLSVSMRFWLHVQVITVILSNNDDKFKIQGTNGIIDFNHN